jgi:hypothetical protein
VLLLLLLLVQRIIPFIGLTVGQIAIVIGMSAATCCIDFDGCGAVAGGYVLRSSECCPDVDLANLT